MVADDFAFPVTKGKLCKILFSVLHLSNDHDLRSMVAKSFELYQSIRNKSDNTVCYSCM